MSEAKKAAWAPGPYEIRQVPGKGPAGKPDGRYWIDSVATSKSGKTRLAGTVGEVYATGQGSGNSEDTAHLIAAAPDLYASLVECVDLAWIETRDVHFDDSVVMGHGYDWEGWEHGREELHFRGGSFAVWPNQIGGKCKWSLYSTVDGGMWFEKFETADDAKGCAYRELTTLCLDHPAAKARAILAKARGERP